MKPVVASLPAAPHQPSSASVLLCPALCPNLLSVLLCLPVSCPPLWPPLSCSVSSSVSSSVSCVLASTATSLHIKQPGTHPSPSPNSGWHRAPSKPAVGKGREEKCTFVSICDGTTVASTHYCPSGETCPHVVLSLTSQERVKKNVLPI